MRCVQRELGEAQGWSTKLLARIKVIEDEDGQEMKEQVRSSEKIPFILVTPIKIQKFQIKIQNPN